MEPQSIYAILITLITVLGSAGAWKFYTRKAELKREDQDFIRDDFRDRIDKLELLLEQSAKEKDDLRQQVLDLTKQIAELSIKIKFVQEENRRLTDINNELRGGNR